MQCCSVIIMDKTSFFSIYYRASTAATLWIEHCFSYFTKYTSEYRIFRRFLASHPFLFTEVSQTFQQKLLQSGYGGISRPFSSNHYNITCKSLTFPTLNQPQLLSLFFVARSPKPILKSSTHSHQFLSLGQKYLQNCNCLLDEYIPVEHHHVYLFSPPQSACIE